MLDIKSFDPETYKRLTGGIFGPPTPALCRAALGDGQADLAALVLVPGLTDDLTSIEALAAYAGGLGMAKVEVLPFHKMGESKWEALKLPYPLKDTQPPSAELVARVKRIFAGHGLKTV